MKKRRRILLIIIVISIILLAFIGGHAYAQYMSKVTGNGSAKIASWSFKVNEKQDKMQNIYLKSTIDNQKIVNDKIAPGTEGSFSIKIDATDSEVGINYFIKFENETQKPKNLKYIYEENVYNTLEELQKELTGIINANDTEKIKKLIINWKWAYETGTTAEEIALNDSLDTEDAQQLGEYSFDIIVSGTQINPEK